MRTYEEKLAELERLKAEVAGRPQFLTMWDSASIATAQDRNEDDFEAVDAPRVDVPLVIAEEEAQRLFPRSNVAVIPASANMGRKGLPEDFVQLMYRCYRRGKSLTEVGRIYGRTRQSVWDLFHRRRLKLRPSAKERARIEFVYHGVNYAPSVDGYLRATTGKRRMLQQMIWEEFRGPVPRGQQIVFRDGNKRNFNLENLECVPAAEWLARVSCGDNETTKIRKLLIAKGEWKPKKPSRYDMAFVKWFSRHGWQIRDGLGKIDVWTNAEAVCRFKVNALMLERLAAAGLIERFFPPGEADSCWCLAEQARNGRAAA